MTVFGLTLSTRPSPQACAREVVLRECDRLRVRNARSMKRPLLLLSLLVGPGILTMLGENDGPSVLSYVTSGATYGIGFFAPFILVTFLFAFIVQEATVRIGVATNRGHAELITQRFGIGWGRFAMLDLTIGNVLTIMTEFIAIRAGAAYFGIPPFIAILGAGLIVASAFATRRYFTWERAVLVLALGNLIFVPIALRAEPNPGAFLSAFLAPSIHGGMSITFCTLVLANVGATVTPWMIFFQQSAVVDKGLTARDLNHGRFDTMIGVVLAVVAALATLIIGSVLFAHHVQAPADGGGLAFAQALQPFVGPTGSTLFALGMIEAGLVAAITIAASSSYATGELFQSGRSLNQSLSGGWLFYATGIATVILAGGIVLIPHAPLLAMTLAVNVIATVLMAPALLFVLLLANDGEIMGPLKNGRLANAAGGLVIAVVSVLGAGYGLITIFPHIFGS